MRQTSDPAHSLHRYLGAPPLRQLFWSKLSRPMLLLLALLIGSTVALGLALSGLMQADRYAFGFALAAIGVFALVIYRMRRRLRFVRHLREWAERMRGGNLSAKIPYTGESDLDDVIEDINSLGGMLEKLALEMDAHSHAQTVRLARKTQALDILYEIALSLTRPGDLNRQLESFLDAFIELVDARAATVHLLDNDPRDNGDRMTRGTVTDDEQMRLIASRRFEASTDRGETLAITCPYCGWSAARGGVHVLTGARVCLRRPGARNPSDTRQTVIVPVEYQNRVLGVYALYLDWPVTALGEDALELLVSIGRHLGLAIEKARLDSDARRLAIMEERNIIGNELHDSLAQSLVSMRLRVKMLGEILHRKDLRAAQNEVRQLREGLDAAHASLRELLANFRLRIDERGLVQAVENLAQRFSAETGIAVFFHNECGELALTPQQEIQAYHIIQEALSNIRKHSRANTARIRIDSDAPGRYTVLIEDDGEGMVPPEESLPGEHIGLTVMQERARRLPGELTIESEPGEGTRVLLSFTSAETPPPARAVG